MGHMMKRGCEDATNIVKGRSEQHHDFRILRFHFDPLRWTLEVFLSHKTVKNVAGMLVEHHRDKYGCIENIETHLVDPQTAAGPSIEDSVDRG